jgi:hypothetical protein
MWVPVRQLAVLTFRSRLKVRAIFALSRIVEAHRTIADSPES